MVAKSFQSMKIAGEPFKENGRLYVTVTDGSKSRKVRWYSEAEYKKMYPEAKEKVEDSLMSNQSLALGFAKGYITIFKGEDTYDWFYEHEELRYHRTWGWYLPSDLEMPAGKPEGLVPIRLDWTMISSSGTRTNSEEEVRKVVDSLIYEPTPSRHMGKIGEKLVFTGTLYDKKIIEKDYGFSAIHFFKDKEENVYVWNTSSKSLDLGATYTLSGTVKGHPTYRNCKQTWLTRCSVK